MPPRPIRPKNDPGAPEGSEHSTDSKGGKRKAVSSACIPCRKRKSKVSSSLSVVRSNFADLGTSVMVNYHRVRLALQSIGPSAATMRTVTTDGKVH